MALARMLAHYDREHTVVFHDDKFEKTTPDTEWLPAVASWDPVPAIISGDGRILRNPSELQVLRGLPLTFFLFADAWAGLPWRERAWKAVKVWPEIVSAADTRRPTIFRIPISAIKVDRVCLTSELGSGKHLH
ncbi:MAG: hypothetical protein JNK16_03880 [Phycisphaerales bacterium]|nr:hypothetical protein [Phycisphaerales bacterium]